MSHPPHRPWWREPLLHFLILGAGLYGADVWTSPPAVETVERDAPQIVVSDAWRTAVNQHHIEEHGKPPAPEEVDALLDEFVEQEALYLEALRLGLGQRDLIVRRRLIQKMSFLLEDMADVPEPSEQELQRWLQDGEARYRSPRRVSLDHVYISRDRHGGGSGQEATRVREALKGGADFAKQGDPFIAGRSFEGRSRRELEQLFGGPFAQEVEGLTAGSGWSAPLRSSYGLHLVRVRAVEEARLPALSEIRRTVRRDWLTAQRAKKVEEARKDLVARYEVIRTTEVTP